MKPTDEQLAALDIFRRGESMVIEAGAGTGKTSTLRLLASSTKRRGRYLAFNKAIVTDVERVITQRVAASTAHALAMRAIGGDYRHRLGSPRMRSALIAQKLGIRSMVVHPLGMPKVLQPGYLAGHTMRAVTKFCQTADEEPSARHFPFIDGIDYPDRDGRPTATNNIAVAKELEPALQRAWADVCSRDGMLPFKHDHYLKIWQLGHPRIETDFILFDEAQDANPVMAAVIAEQTHAQRVHVGDSQQAIYEFTGAINALAEIDIEKRVLLTQSFRFGQAIADEANSVLEMLGADLRIVGLDSIDSIVEKIDGEPDAILCRTNATAVTEMLRAQRRMVSARLEGGGTEVLQFADAAAQLRTEHWTAHPELACFTSWNEVLEYVAQDAQGRDLKLMVDLVEEFGIDVIKRALDDMPAVADLTISTAHKAKGREWDRVRIADDFAELSGEPPELRLRYVAYTRARRQLDESIMHVEQPQLEPADERMPGEVFDGQP